MNKSLFGKKPIYYVNALISVFLMFVMPQLVHVSGTGDMTQTGIEVLMVLIGMIWGLLFCSMGPISILALVALGLTSYCSAAESLAAAFSNQTLWMMLAFAGFCGVFSASGVSDWMAKKIISSKVGHGRPWIFALLVLFAMFIIGGFTVSIVMLFAIWEVIYQIGENMGLDNHKSQYMKYLISGVTFCCVWCGSCWPFSSLSVTYMGLYETAMGTAMEGAKYSAVLVPTMLCAMVAYVLVGRFILKVPTDDVQNCRTEFDIPELTTYQKIVFGALIVLVGGCFCISMLPKTWAITQFLIKVGVFGFIFIVDAVLFVLSFAEGIPLNDAMAKGLSFDLYFGFGAIMVLASAVSDGACGISTWLSTILTPLFGNMSPILFVILVCFAAMICTQFMSNMVVLVLFSTVVFAMGPSLGVNCAVALLVLVHSCNAAFCTPAANPVAGICFSNKYLESKDSLKYGIAATLTTFVVNLLIGIPLGYLFFG